MNPITPFKAHTPLKHPTPPTLSHLILRSPLPWRASALLETSLMVPLCLGVHHGPFPTAFCGPSCWRTATESRGIKSREAAGWLLGSYQLLQSPNLRSSNLETRCKPKHTSQQSPGEGSLRRSHVACLQLNTADLARRWLCTTGAMSSRIRAALWGHWRVQGLGQQGRVLGSGFMALGFWHTRIAWMYAGCVGFWVRV